MKLMTIMQGLPGSGKSTLAKELYQESREKCLCAVIHSTDALFYKDGVYKFHPAQLGPNHKLNQKHVEGACEDSVDHIIVDNTNLTWKEVKPYCAMALKHEYDVEFVRPNNSWSYDPEECFKRCTHGVPLDTIQKMLDRFQDSLLFQARWVSLKRLYGEL